MRRRSCKSLKKQHVPTRDGRCARNSGDTARSGTRAANRRDSAVGGRVARQPVWICIVEKLKHMKAQIESLGSVNMSSLLIFDDVSVLERLGVESSTVLSDGLLLALFALKTNAFRAMSCKTDFIIHLAPIGLGFGKDVTGQVLPLLLHCFCFFSQLLLSKLSLGLRYTPMKPAKNAKK
ncbi:unnamed protein product [Heligmosomoides polygyrus]|uniref:Uncharacterized protein n=1 Tax=Heligmosomoides polygyrus TaxID=6339 RepID=A0A183F7D9_HELPZ|nr:unnamed protein product [Heligmosomoides polygyrus]